MLNETFFGDFQTVYYNTWYVWFRKIRWKRMRLRGSIQGWSVGGSTFFECPCVNRVPQNAFELWCNTCLEASHAFGLCRTFVWTAQWAKILQQNEIYGRAWLLYVKTQKVVILPPFTYHEEYWLKKSDGTSILPHHSVWKSYEKSQKSPSTS